MGLLLAPATRENLEISIENSVDINLVNQFLDTGFVNGISQLAGIEGVRCWALTHNNIALFNKIQKGDEVLLSERRTGLFTHYAVVVGKTQNANFGSELWPFVGNDMWEYIYFLANITLVNINKQELVAALGYEPNYNVPGPIKVRERDYLRYGTIARRFDIPVLITF